MYTKGQVDYRRTVGPQSCDRCRHYVDAGRTGFCRIVYGTIYPEDTCDVWEPMLPQERGIIKRRRVLPLDMLQ